MWTLVLIMFVNGELISDSMGSYDQMVDCFFAREKLSFDLGGQDGYYPTNTQAVCVYRDRNDKI